ncbi:META domain-containing protein [Arthrobacter sp. KNU-44]|uniref:META domain-containing protein n=1 Tax=unclassified Arthrobacter TaxID=235627 RepID=UPI003F43B04F
MVTCTSFLPSAPCSQYVSISGTSNGAALPWVAAGGLRVELYSVNGGLQFAAKTPCNPISGPAAIAGNTLTLGKLAVGAMGCVGDSSAQEQWVTQFLGRPIEMSFVHDTLTWTTGADTLSFKGK